MSVVTQKQEASVVPWNFQGKEVRIIQINGNPWWYASEVCTILGIINGRDAIKSMPEDEKSTVDSTDGGPARNIISEGGLYRLVFQSRKLEAESFRKWVTSEVLPQIRKTGSYQKEMSRKEILELALQAEIALEAANQIIAEQAPKVALAEQCLMAINSQSVTEVAKVLQIGRNRLFETLRNSGHLDHRNIPYQQYLERGYYEVKEHPIVRGDLVINYAQTFVTAKGLNFIRSLIAK
jgi:prophage antirepressor-like protein